MTSSARSWNLLSPAGSALVPPQLEEVKSFRRRGWRTRRRAVTPESEMTGVSSFRLRPLLWILCLCVMWPTERLINHLNAGFGLYKGYEVRGRGRSLKSDTMRGWAVWGRAARFHIKLQKKTANQRQERVQKKHIRLKRHPTRPLSAPWKTPTINQTHTGNIITSTAGVTGGVSRVMWSSGSGTKGSNMARNEILKLVPDGPSRVQMRQNRVLVLVKGSGVMWTEPKRGQSDMLRLSWGKTRDGSGLRWIRSAVRMLRLKGNGLIQHRPGDSHGGWSRCLKRFPWRLRICRTSSDNKTSWTSNSWIQRRNTA